MSRSGRGFEDEARQRVIDAARRSGLSVGDLVQALSDTARRPLRAPEPGGERRIERRLDDLSERMRRLGGADRDRMSRPARPEASNEAALEEIAATVGRLSGGRARSATPATGARDAETGRILDMLEGLDRRVRAMSEERAPRAAEPAAPAPAPTARGRRAPTAEARAATRGTTAEADPLDRRFRDLGDKIEQLRQRDDRESSSALIAEIRALRTFVESRAGGGADVSAEIRRLAGKIDKLADQRPQREVIESLATEIGRLRDVVLQSNVEGSLRTIEEGYGHIVDRLDDLKRGMVAPRDESRIDEEISEIRNLLRTVPKVDHLSSLERNLDTLSDKFERLAAREEPSSTQQIERRLTDLRTQMEALDPSRLVVALDQRLQAVTDKLDALERSTRVPAAPDRVVTLLEELRAIATGNRTGEQIALLEERIADLGDRIAEFEARRPSLEDTDRLHERIAEIAGRLDDIARPDDGRHTGELLEAAVARLDAAIAAASSPRAEARIDARFDELIDRIDRRMPADPTADVEALTREITEMRRDLAAARPADDLEEQMRLLAERLDRSVAHEGDDEALALIEEQLANISRQIETGQDRFREISTLESHILRLAEQMESNHLDSVTAAREAAREMVRELSEGRRGDDGASEAAMRALQDDLRALQSAARDTETRTNDTLISLHDALTGIVGRLTAIEKIAQGSARSAAAARNAAQAAETAAQAATQPSPLAAPRPFAAEASARAVEPTPTVQAEPQPTIAGRPVTPNPVMRARELLAAATPDDNRPLEPGSGKPKARAGGSAAAQPAIVEPARPAGDAPASPAAARKADFIAAARRAAQAAAADAEAPTVQPADRPAAAPSDAPASESGALSRIGKVLKGRRRPLVLATAALVLAILTLQVMPGRKSAPVATADNATVVEQTVPAESAPRATVAERAPAPASADDAMLSKAPTGAPVVGFPMPMATDAATAPKAKPATADAAPAAPAPAVAPTAESSAAPTTTGSIPAAPATTGSIAAATPAPATETLPDAIGPAGLRTAALAGDAKAAFEVGLRFAEGRGVAADPAKAVVWYEKAAAKGLAPAQYRLGVAYEKGLGIARDSDKARSWYKAAAEQGNVRAMHNLGVSFANARDMANAVPWFQKAADLGLRDSQFNLGIIHALGSGVKQDLAVSYKWFSLAARQGDGEAEKKQAEIATHLDKVNLAAARMAVQTWVQRPLDHAANDEAHDWGDPETTASVPGRDGADLVRRAQQMLKAKGFYAGTVDGDAGPGTKTAIRAFQKKAGLAPTGEVDAALMAALAGRSL